MRNGNKGRILPETIAFEDVTISIIDRSGAAWVTGPDLARALGYGNARSVANLFDRYKDEFTAEMVAVIKMVTAGSPAPVDVRIFSARGCYLISMLAKTERAKAFRKWVLDVLENLIKPQIDLENPAFLRATLLDYTDKVIALQEEVKELTPKAQGLDRIAAWSEGTLCVTDAAKALQMQRKDLFAWLQSHRWLYRRAGNAHWVGYQDKIQQGLVEMKVGEIIKPDGESKITENVRITPKGLAKLSAIHANQEGV